MPCADNVMDNVFDYLKELNKGLTQLCILGKDIARSLSYTYYHMPTNSDTLFTILFFFK